jgi:hypothetical protein
MKRHAIFIGAALLSLVSPLSYAQAPLPFVNQQLVPDTTAPGGAQFTLTVNGTGFVSSSVVKWNGDALVTQFISGTQLTAIVPAEDIAKATTASVTVVTPAPGGGTSNVAFFTVYANTGNSVSFVVGTALTGGANSNSVAVGDFNGDGKLDVAVANRDSNNASILLGDGTGNFTIASTPSVGWGPEAIAVGDFNGDGKLDFAATNVYDNTVSIMLGDGTGNFTLASSLPYGGGKAAVGDFNGDGKLDFALPACGNGVCILEGDGTGNFTLASSPNYGGGSVALGDFNRDGKLDLAIAGYGNGICILLGDGTGNFTFASSMSGDYPYSIKVGDFNGDGKLDLATANSGRFDTDNTASIYLGDGTGNFRLVSSPVVGKFPDAVAVGDFNGDDKLDLAVASYWDGTVSILLGDGRGNFTLASTPSGMGLAFSVAVGDFNGDGKLDLVVANGSNYVCGSCTVSIAMGLPPGPYVTYNPTSLTFGPQLLGTSSPPQPVTLTNIGTAPLDITGIVTNKNFSQTNNCPRPLPPDGQCTANVVFTPRNVNTISGTITLTDNATNSPQTIAVSGAGTAVTLLPSRVDFGYQKVGTTSPPQTVTLTNYAPVPVTIFGGDIAYNNTGWFKFQSTTCQHNLGAGSSCTINLVFAPTGLKGRTATLEVNDNGGLSPQTVLLIGRGTN